ncbi:hypothetical protein GH714_024485 [Hevea brasiliensis]|uniref:Uncharacterized protein n=1 Tax=Hevea brasiliensis TaxID=3981 RepID=A0A6A6MY98_HEVBR|nr:hypothetical protein GH714_024485 [Hevea brasiliensis]
MYLFILIAVFAEYNGDFMSVMADDMERLLTRYDEEPPLDFKIDHEDADLHLKIDAIDKENLTYDYSVMSGDPAIGVSFQIKVESCLMEDPSSSAAARVTLLMVLRRMKRKLRLDKKRPWKPL